MAHRASGTRHPKRAFHRQWQGRRHTYHRGVCRPHLRSDLERRRGRQWQLDQAAQGKDEVMIHRGRVGQAFIARVLDRAGAGLADNPGP